MCGKNNITIYSDLVFIKPPKVEVKIVKGNLKTRKIDINTFVITEDIEVAVNIGNEKGGAP